MYKISLFIATSFLLLSACTEYNENDLSDKSDTTVVIRESRLEDKISAEERSDEQIKHLEKIIAQNKLKLADYEQKISSGDTLEVRGLPEFVEELKKAIILKEKRLSKIRRK